MKSKPNKWNIVCFLGANIFLLFFLSAAYEVYTIHSGKNVLASITSSAVKEIACRNKRKEPDFSRPTAPCYQADVSYKMFHEGKEYIGHDIDFTAWRKSKSKEFISNIVESFPEGSTHRAYLKVRKDGTFRSKLGAGGSIKFLVILFSITALLYAAAFIRKKPNAVISTGKQGINLLENAPPPHPNEPPATTTGKLGVLFQIYLNIRIIRFSLNWLIVCLGAGHAVGYMTDFFPESRLPEFLTIILLTASIVFFLVFLWNFLPIVIKDLILVFFIPSKSSSIYERFGELENRFVFTKAFRQWRNHEHKWLPVGMAAAVFLMAVGHMYQKTNMEASVVILKAGAIYLTLPLAIASGLSFLILYEVFRLVDSSEAELSWRESMTVPELAKKLSIYLVGQTMGQVAFLYPITEFANTHFSDPHQKVELVAQHWRESTRWCHGLEVEYQAPLFPFAINRKHEQILCFDESYRRSFKLGTKIIASGPGTFLGTTVHEISSPDNEIGTMKTPVWD